MTFNDTCGESVCYSSYSAVQSQCDHHDKEDDGKEGGAHHVRNGLRVRDKQ